jgi:hypothetical protein
MVAMSMLTKEVICKNLDFNTDNPAEFRKYLIVSIGTGSAKQSEKYTTPQCAKWGLLRWLYDGDFNPLIDILSHASADMVDIHASTPRCSSRRSDARRTTSASKYTFVHC